MGRKPLSMSEKIRRYFAVHPFVKPREVANALGVKVSLVYAVRYKKPNKVSLAKPLDMDAIYKAKYHEDVTKLAHDPKHDPKPDMVNSPPHYKDGGIETIDFLQAKLTREEFIGYLKGNVLKYGSRLGKKGAVGVDAGKMAWYAVKLRDTLSTSA